MSKKLYVGGVSYTTTQQGLADAFAAHGKVISAQIIVDKMTNQSRGFGFVEMGSDAEATKAIETLNGQVVDGRPLTVSEAKPQAPREGGGGGGRGGSSGGRGGRY